MAWAAAQIVGVLHSPCCLHVPRLGHVQAHCEYMLAGQRGEPRGGEAGLAVAATSTYRLEKQSQWSLNSSTVAVLDTTFTTIRTWCYIAIEVLQRKVGDFHPGHQYHRHSVLQLLRKQGDQRGGSLAGQGERIDSDADLQSKRRWY